MNEDDIHSVFRSVICAQENNRAVEDWNPADFARLAGVNRLSRTEMSEDHHWRCSSGKWSPEYCVIPSFLSFTILITQNTEGFVLVTTLKYLGSNTMFVELHCPMNLSDYLCPKWFLILVQK